jgi:hypothetical protein
MHVDTLGGMRQHLTPIQSKHRNRFKPEPALILAPTKIHPRETFTNEKKLIAYNYLTKQFYSSLNISKVTILLLMASK